MKVGIIGASSQVGSSLAFYFKHFTDVEPVCFVRSSYSAVFFDICGISYDTADLNDSEKLKQRFAELDGIIDCTYPSSQLYEMPASIEKNLNSVISAMPAGSFFIYMSTIMAFGMPTGYKTVRHFGIPQTTYAFMKRHAERLATKLCAAHGIKGYNFRLGQVHGFLQSVNASYREKLDLHPVLVLDGKPTDPVNIIFISSLGNAIIKVGENQLATGLYSLVNEPQWTLKELYNFYIAYYNRNNTLQFSERSAGSLVNGIKTTAMGRIRKWRPLLESYFLIGREKLYKKVKGKYRVKEVAASLMTTTTDGYSDFHLVGKNPGTLINNLDTSVEQVYKTEKQMEQLYNNCLQKATITAGGI